jgi:hypothetical protein
MLPKARPAGFQRGDAVCIIEGAFTGQLAVFQGMAGAGGGTDDARLGSTRTAAEGGNPPR